MYKKHGDSYNYWTGCRNPNFGATSSTPMASARSINWSIGSIDWSGAVKDTTVYEYQLGGGATEIRFSTVTNERQTRRLKGPSFSG